VIGLDSLTMEGLKLLLSITIVVLGVAMTLIGYFMSKRDSAITRATENLTTAVEQLKEIVNSLQTQYGIRQPIVDERLNKHSDEIADHEDRLTKLETKHDMIHCETKRGK